MFFFLKTVLQMLWRSKHFASALALSRYRERQRLPSCVLVLWLLLGATGLSIAADSPPISYGSCHVNGRLQFTDQQGCLENYPFLISLGQSYRAKLFNLAVSSEPQACAFSFGVHHGQFGNASVYVTECGVNGCTSTARNFGTPVAVCQKILPKECACQEIDAIAKTKTESEFRVFVKELEERKRVGWKKDGAIIALSTPASELAPQAPATSTAAPIAPPKNEVAAKAQEDRREQVRLARENAERDRLAKAEEELRAKKDAMERLAAQAGEERRARERADSERLARAEEDLRLRQELMEKREKEIAERLAVAQRLEQNAKSAKPEVPTTSKKAFVIGNNNYVNVSRLQTAVADSTAMADVLKNLGYQVSRYSNMGERDFRRALRNFVSAINVGDEVVFFYAGHGVQLDNKNYLLPTDITADNSLAIRDEAIDLNRVLSDLSDAKARVTLAIVDACRDDPFKGKALRSLGTRGLAPTTAASGQMIVFSAGAGQQALDKLSPADNSPNGLFTRIFLKHITAKGVTVDQIVRNVRNEVVVLAKGVGREQVPAIYDQLVGEFYFSK